MYVIWLLLTLSIKQPPFCSCLPLGPINDEQYNEYSLIVKGKIKSVKDEKFERVILLSVSTYFKGGSNDSTVTILSPLQSGMCGIFPKEGEQWLMFAYSKDNSYNTYLCTRTKNMNPEAWNYKKEEIEGDIGFLMKKLKSPSR